MPHTYKEQMEVVVDATLEQVWEAIATGPGITSWYMGQSEVEPRVGGAVRIALGSFVLESTVTAYEPLKRFGYRMPADPDGSFLALELVIEGRDGGGTIVRCVGSGFIGADDWEGEYDSLKKGGAFYFHNLAQYITYFPGRTATLIKAVQSQAGDPEHVWTALRGGLGLAGIPRESDSVRLTPVGLAPIEGVVDYATPEFLGIRASEGLYRFFLGGGPLAGAAVVEHRLFADVRQQDVERAWQSWLTRLFA